MQEMIADYFGVWGSYAKYAMRFGMDAHLILVNCAPMQKQWAKENRFQYSENNWSKEIAIEQIKKISPDVFYIGSMFEFYGNFLETIKPYCKKIFGWIACPVPQDVKLNQLDLILTSVPEMVNDFKKIGINSELLPAAFDADVLNSLSQNIEQDIDFSFIGGIGSAHTKRIELLSNLAKHTPIQLFGYGYYNGPSWKLKLKKIFSPNTLEARYISEVWGLEMYRTLQRSKITFNAHIDMALGNRVNMRMYEATGTGTLLLTDKSDKSEVEYFVDGREVVYYSSTDDAIEKVQYYLAHEKERKEIAIAGQKKTIEKYNFEINMKQMLYYFEKYS